MALLFQSRGIPYGSADYQEYLQWFARGQRDEAPPNDVAGDPDRTYLRTLGYRHGRLLRELPCISEDRRREREERRRDEEAKRRRQWRSLRDVEGEPW